MSARNPLIVRADICGFSARSSAEKVKFSVSCTVCVRESVVDENGCHSVIPYTNESLMYTYII